MESPLSGSFGCPCCAHVGRRDFLREVALMSAGVSAAAGLVAETIAAQEPPLRTAPIAKQPPVIKVGYLRHPRAYSGGWPGHGFN